jgi:hypothetical protein
MRTAHEHVEAPTTTPGVSTPACWQTLWRGGTVKRF